MNSIQSIRRCVEWLRTGRDHKRSALFGISRDSGHNPSSLHGEKVAEGRMRGGRTRRFSMRTYTFQHPLALSPLSPALSPLRGEGERSASPFRGAFAKWRVRREHNRGIVFSFRSDCLTKGTFPINIPRLPFACQRWEAAG